jgi:molybdopterin converting factor small subunit
MATLRLFANLREIAGTSTVDVPAETVAGVIDEANDTYGPDFARAVTTAKVWVNGEPANPEMALAADDEVALLPPVSGGAVATRLAADPMENALGLVLLSAILVAGWLPLEWFTIIVVGATLAALWDLADVDAVGTGHINIWPTLISPVAAAVGAYAWGLAGFAGGIALGIIVALAWPVFDARHRGVEMTATTTTVGLIAGLGTGAFVLLRMRSTTVVIAFVIIAAAGIVAGTLAGALGSRTQTIDPNVGTLIGSLLAGVLVGLIVDELDLAVALVASVSLAAGLIAGRALGSMLRTGTILHTQRAPGLLTSIDGIWVAAPLFWLTLRFIG